MFFDRVVIDQVNRADAVQEYASGKSVNVARVAHQLGERVLAAGFLGGDRGRFMRLDLDRAGIVHQFIEVPARTRLCTTVVDRSAGTATELVEESTPIEPQYWEALREVVRTGARASAFCSLSGSLPPEAPQDFYAECIEIAQRDGRLVLLDARGEPLRRALAHAGFIAKLNRDELADTVHRPVDDEQALRHAMGEILPRGGAVIVTAGSREVFAFDGETTWRVRPPRVKAVSAVGSGDAFAAGMAVALLRRQPFPDALKQAAACGAANALTPLAGYVRNADVNELLQEVTVEVL